MIVEIWEDADFIALSPLAQRAYMFLLSQPDLAHTGVIALRPKRWARKSPGLTAAQLGDNLAELEAARFLIVDDETEEVLVRSFMRRDRVFKQPNVMRAAADHVPLVESQPILRQLTAEMARIRSENGELSEQQELAMSEMDKALLARVSPSTDPTPGNPSGNPSPNPSGRGTANPTGGAPGDLGVVTVRTTGFPVPRSSKSPDPENTSLALLADFAEDPSPKRARADPKDFDRFWDVYPRRESKGAARKAWAKAIKIAEPDVIIAAAKAYRDNGMRQRADPKFTKHPATWLNNECWTDEPLPAHQQEPEPQWVPKPSTADLRVGQALAIAAEFRNEAQQGIAS